MAAAPPLTTIATTTTQNDRYHSIDRIAFSAIVLPCAGGPAIALPSVLSFETSKGDDGEAGTFSMVLPMAPTCAGGVPNPAPQYAKIANPMDVVAIYALRLVSTDAAVQGAPTGVPQTPPSSVSWKQPGSVQALAADPTCIFIGMLDQARVRVDLGGPTAHLVLNGKDLTKIFLTNDTMLPVVIASLAAYDLTALQAIINAGESSASALVEKALDVMVSRQSVQGVNASVLQQYAFPWRNFISTAKVDQNFQPLAPAGSGSVGNLIPPYRIQDGSAWSNMTDLRNSPISRLFVDEFGNLIFDEALPAWGLQGVSGTTPQASAYQIRGGEVLSYDFYIDDSALITLLTVWPTLFQFSTGTPASLGLLKGIALDQMLPGSNAVAGSPTAIDASDVQRYGARYGLYTSFWDTSVEAAHNRWKALVVNHNSVCFGEVTVRGRSVYSVGKRVQVSVQTHRPEFQDATWYITNCSHSGTYGDTWTTHLTLRYPVVNGAVH